MTRLFIPLFLFAATLLAQDTPRTSPRFPLWTAPLPKSQGAYAVSLNSICSVALEQYDLKYDDQTFPVTECSIETVGGKTARFYFIDEGEEEDKGLAGDLLKTAASAVPGLAGEDDDQKLRVVKVYPESALAGTVEYRLASKAKVEDLYRELHDTWVASSP